MCKAFDIITASKVCSENESAEASSMEKCTLSGTFFPKSNRSFLVLADNFETCGTLSMEGKSKGERNFRKKLTDIFNSCLLFGML